VASAVGSGADALATTLTRLFLAAASVASVRRGHRRWVADGGGDLDEGSGATLRCGTAPRGADLDRR
jgi:hypothetical protein